MPRLLALLAPLLLLAPALHARELPRLPDTRLFKSVARGCADVAPAAWTHPARALLQQRGVQLLRVQLCNNRQYPVLHVHFPFDPQGQTEDWFGPLYAALRQAGAAPLAFVAPRDGSIVYLEATRVDYESFRP